MAGEENKTNGNGNNNFVISKIMDLSREVNSIGKDTENQLENLSVLLKKIEINVDSNMQMVNKHSVQIEKFYQILSATVTSLKNLKTGIQMKVRELNTQIKSMVKKPRWKTIYTVLLGIGTLIALALANIERIKNIFSH